MAPAKIAASEPNFDRGGCVDFGIWRSDRVPARNPLSSNLLTDMTGAIARPAGIDRAANWQQPSEKIASFAKCQSSDLGDFIGEFGSHSSRYI